VKHSRRGLNRQERLPKTVESLGTLGQGGKNISVQLTLMRA
jgi:hypothetical protein